MADHFVCRCKAYHFPHQISKGKCDGSGWLQKYHRELHDKCLGCEHHHIDRGPEQLCDCRLADDIFIRRSRRDEIHLCPAYYAEAKTQGVKP